MYTVGAFTLQIFAKFIFSKTSRKLARPFTLGCNFEKIYFSRNFPKICHAERMRENMQAAVNARNHWEKPNKEFHRRHLP